MHEEQVKIGMTVDYHGIIDGPVTKANCTVRSEPWDLCGTQVVLISGVSGGVALDAITPSQ